MKYCRINLEQTNYTEMSVLEARLLVQPEIYIDQLQSLYKTYCIYKKFKSVMPIFNSEFTDHKNNVIAYHNNDNMIAFSLIRIYDEENVEAIQFAWDYKNPELKLGFRSLEHECAFYKGLGYKFYYLGAEQEYKNQIKGYELLGNYDDIYDYEVKENGNNTK
jgi:hypothetical protein